MENRVRGSSFKVQPLRVSSNPSAIYAVILAGGSGQRFWPLSRDCRPKQLLKLFDDRTLLEHTLARLDGFVPRQNILVLTNRQQLDAVRRVWASVWSFRAFEERSYRSIPHESVAMALLVHRSFPDEEANGVALTNNPFDKSGADPAFYVNVQFGELSVVQPEPNTTTEEFLQYFDLQGQPVSYLSNSNLVPAGERVLVASQVQELGVALDRIRDHFAPAYAAAGGAWWAMDVEFKFDADGDELAPLYIKQARPFGNR